MNYAKLSLLIFILITGVLVYGKSNIIFVNNPSKTFILFTDYSNIIRKPDLVLYGHTGGSTYPRGGYSISNGVMNIYGYYSSKSNYEDTVFAYIIGIDKLETINYEVKIKEKSYSCGFGFAYYKDNINDENELTFQINQDGSGYDSLFGYYRSKFSNPGSLNTWYIFKGKITKDKMYVFRPYSSEVSGSYTRNEGKILMFVFRITNYGRGNGDVDYVKIWKENISFII